VQHLQNLVREGDFITTDRHNSNKRLRCLTCGVSSRLTSRHSSSLSLNVQDCRSLKQTLDAHPLVLFNPSVECTYSNHTYNTSLNQKRADTYLIYINMPQLRWLVTGCSSGLGEEFVRRILSRGDKVVASTRGDVSRLSSLQEAGAETISLDVTAAASDINAVVNKVLEGGPIDVLVNNAGYIEAAMAEEVRYADMI